MVTVVVRNQRFPIVDGLLVLLVGCITAALALPSGTPVSHRQMVASAAVDLDGGVRSSHQTWNRNSRDVQRWNSVELQFNEQGWPTGQSIGAMNGVQDCEAIWQAFLDGRATADASPVSDYRVSRDDQTCFYTYSGDVQQSRRIQYSANTGRVQVLNP